MPLSSSLLSGRVSSPPVWAQVLQRAPLPRAPRRRSPAPLPRLRRSLPFRPPTLRRLPAVTARCRLRNCPSRNPFHPPLGESLGPLYKWVPWVAVLAGVTSSAAPPLSRCYRSLRALSSILRYSLPETARVDENRLDAICGRRFFESFGRS